MSGRFTVTIALVSMLWASGALAQQTQTPRASTQAPLALEELEQMALTNNPTLRQAAASVDAARMRAAQAGAWPNPTVGYVAEEVSPGPVIRGGEHGFFAEQTIPLGGKLRLGRQVFEQEAVEAQSLVTLQEQRVRSAVRTLFYEVLTIERRIEVLDRLSQLAVEAVGISRQLYNVGGADRPDVLVSELEASRAQLDVTAARNRRFALWRHLAATVGDRSLEPRPLASALETDLPMLDREASLSAILQRSPEVMAARATVERNRALVSRARRETSPNLFFRGGLSYNRELLEVGSEPVGWEGALEVGVSLPLFNRNQGGIAAAQAEEGRAAAELQRLELSIEARLANVFDEYLTSVQSVEAYRMEMVPKAEEAYKLYLARYQQMAAAYPQVLIAQRTLVQLNDEYLKYLERAWRAALRIQGFLVDDDGLGMPARAGDGETENPAWAR